MARVRTLLPLLVAATLMGCPAAPPPAATPTTKPTTKTVAKKAPPRVPARINLLLPPAIGLVAAGAGNAVGQQKANLVGNDGASVSQLVGNDGASLVGNDGASLVAAGGGNGLAKAATYALAQAECPDEPVSAKDEFQNLTRTVASVYGNPVLAANACLAAYHEQKADLDESFSFDAPWGERASAKLSARGEAGGLLRVSEGEPYDEAKRVIVVAFDSTTKGRFMYLQPKSTPLYQVLGLASTYDLVKGTASAEAFAIIAPPSGAPAESAPLVRAHMEFKADRADRKRKDAGPAFVMKASGFFHIPGAPCESDQRGMVLHFDDAGRAAARMGRVFKGATGLAFTRKIGTGYSPAADDTTAFFLDEKAQEADLAAAPDGLKALVPVEADFYKPYPADPSGKDQLTDPAFAWPE